jgi:hypothetical protein
MGGWRLEAAVTQQRGVIVAFLGSRSKTDLNRSVQSGVGSTAGTGRMTALGVGGVQGVRVAGLARREPLAS